MSVGVAGRPPLARPPCAATLHAFSKQQRERRREAMRSRIDEAVRRRIEAAALYATEADVEALIRCLEL